MNSSNDELIRRIRASAHLGSIATELRSDQARAEQADEKLVQDWIQELAFLKSGYEIAIEYLRSNPTCFQELEQPPGEKVITVSDCVIESSEFQLLAQPEVMSEIVCRRETLQALWKMSDAVLIAYYVVAAHLCDQRRFRESQEVFALLTLLHPGVYSFWVGRALCQEGLQAWEEAKQCLRRARLIDPKRQEAHQAEIRIAGAIGESAAVDKSAADVSREE